MQSEDLHNIQPPPRTAMEVFEMLPEGTLAEVIDNVIYVHPSRTFTHQVILGDILTALSLHIQSNKSGECVSWVDVYLGNENAVQPDIIFIAKANLNIIKDGKVKGVPDLIVEVLSGNKKHDLQRKKSLYEAFGVKEYFIVHQKNKEVTTWYHNGNKFVSKESEKGIIKSALLNKTFSF